MGVCRWDGVGKWGDACSVNGGYGERLLSKLLQQFLENIHKGSCNDGRIHYSKLTLTNANS